MFDTTKAFSARADEPDYARLTRTEAPVANQYGKAIELVADGSVLAGKTLNINGDDSVSCHPDRYKQHGFYFNADNCIACHACESACSEKNNLSPHLAFRSVGYVEGGSYPDYHRLNLSMACNHCDDPVCLKGCPTRAYTKFAEYGAVLQDPDICFGCGYCTWVCPYNAPQLDAVNGQVEKCNMCVDRLEAGLKPACVSACLAGALDFGVIETTPENRDQLKTTVPGFPSPDITHPNIRFQQTKSLPKDMVRTDSMPLRYQRDETSNTGYKTQVRRTNSKKGWGLEKLNSRENPLVVFTLMSQAAIGGFLLLILGPVFGLEVVSAAANPMAHAVTLTILLALQGFALLMATIHLGKPMRFYRGFNNLRYSPVSREAAALMVFFGLAACYFLVTLMVSFLSRDLSSTSYSLLVVIQQGCAWGAVVAGPLALYFMHKIYRIPARPFWNHWQVLTSFFGSMLALGCLVVGTVFAVALIINGQHISPLLQLLSLLLFAGLVLEVTGLVFHRRDLLKAGGEGAASLYLQSTDFGKTYWVRNAGLVTAMILALAFYVVMPAGGAALVAWSALAALLVVTLVVGRALFYALVIPTTMPGAFFWRNKGFEQHARQTGLVDVVNSGIVADSH